MKKLSILLVLLLLCGCGNSIASNIYVASMHFAVNDDEYEANFYVINSLALGVSDSTSSGGDASLATIKAKTIAEIFSKLDLSTALDVNLKHVASIILDTSFMKSEYIIELCETIKSNHKLSYNSCIFVSKDDPKEIYKIKNPSNENDLYSIINSPLDRQNLYLLTEPLSLLCFIRDVLNDCYVKIPVFSLNDSWDTEGINYYVNGLCFYKYNDLRIVTKEEYPGLQFLTNHKLLLVGDEKVSFNIKKYKVKFNYKDNLIIDVFFYYDVIYSTVDDSRAYFLGYINEEINRLNELNIDYLNLDYLNKRIKKEYTYNDVVYSFKCKD